MDAKNINCHLKLWPKHESMFPNIGFSVEQILRIISFQIKTKKIFSFASIVTNLKNCQLQSIFFEKLSITTIFFEKSIFVNKIGLIM